MVTEFIMGLAVNLLTALLEKLTGPTVPVWVEGAGVQVDDFLDLAAPFGNFVPFGVAAQVGAAVGVALLAGVAIKLGRMILSLLTAGGGSAG